MQHEKNTHKSKLHAAKIAQEIWNNFNSFYKTF